MRYHNDFWTSEKECHTWLLNVLREVYEFEVIDEPNLVDIFGNKARADIGVLIRRGRERMCFFVIEIKHRVMFSTNAAAAYVQAYHYREMCIVNDPRLPECVNGRSPVFAFAGVFTDICSNPDQWMGHRDLHGTRCDGMGILATSLKVGNVQGDPRNNRLVFQVGEQRLFSLKDDERHIDWCSVNDKYMFGSEKRNGTRRERKSVAERFVESQTFVELF